MAAPPPSGVVPGLPAEYTELVDQMREVQGQLAKHIQAQSQLETQLNENNMVKEELATSPPAVYKMSGRVLVKQDLADAQSTVARRLEYITTEMKRVDATIKSTQDKLNEVRSKIMAAQQRLQQPVAA